VGTVRRISQKDDVVRAREGEEFLGVMGDVSIEKESTGQPVGGFFGGRVKVFCEPQVPKLAVGPPVCRLCNAVHAGELFSLYSAFGELTTH
jgi:hypothetical protein